MQGTLETALEKIVEGDLSKLTPKERVEYYKAVCSSLGLNPLTRPFDYIVLNGRLTLYARKDATDQLRRIHGISITITSRELLRDAGLYVVTARAKTKDGREDESIGAVSIVGLKGDALANALMKAESKAKRRVTLSIAGLGMLDESEIESIPDARPMEAVEAEPDPPVRGMEPKTQALSSVTPPETGGEADEQRGVFRVLAVNRVVKGDQTFAIAKVVSEDGEEFSVAARGEVMERVEAMKGAAASVVLKKNDRGWWIVEKIDLIPGNGPVQVEERPAGQDGPDGMYEVIDIVRRKTPQGTPYAQITLKGAEGKFHVLAREQAYADVELLGLEPGKKIRAEIEERNGFKYLTRVLEPVEV